LNVNVTTHLFACYFSKTVSWRLTTSHDVSILFNLSGEKQATNHRDPNAVQKWAENALSTITIAEERNKKGAQDERLNNQL
jgi:hypothetical protein